MTQTLCSLMQCTPGRMLPQHTRQAHVLLPCFPSKWLHETLGSNATMPLVMLRGTRYLSPEGEASSAPFCRDVRLQMLLRILYWPACVDCQVQDPMPALVSH